MPNIENYAPGPGSLADRLVGTRGYDESAGSAYAQIAQGLGALRDRMASADQYQTQQAFNTLSSLGSTLGHILGRAAKVQTQAQNATQKMLNHTAVSNKMAAFQQATNNMSNRFQQQFRQDPQNAVDAFREMLDNNAPGGDGNPSFVDPDGKPIDTNSLMAWAQSDPNISKDPHALNYLVGRLNEIKTSALDKTDNWAFNQQTANAHNDAENLGVSVNQTLSADEAPLAARLQNYKDTVLNADTTLKSQISVLGQPYVDKTLNKLHMEAAATYFGAGVANRPEDPQGAISHLTTLRGQLQQNNNLGMPLPEAKKLSLLKEIDSQINFEVDELTKKELVNEAQDDFDITNKLFYLSENRDKPWVQNQAMSWAHDELIALNNQVAAINANPTYTDKAKLKLVGRLQTQAGRLRAVVDKAHSNLQFQESEARRDASDARREANAARTENNRALAEQRRQENEARREQRDAANDVERTTKSELDAMQYELTLQMLDPIKNRDAIIKGANAMNAKALEAGRTNAIDSGAAKRYALTAVKTMQMASMFDVRQVVFGLLPNTIQRLSPTAKKDAPKVAEKNKQLLQEMETHRLNMQQDREDETINKHVLQMNTAQQNEFNRVWPELRATAQAQGKTPQQITQLKNQVTNRVIKRIPGKPEPPRHMTPGTPAQMQQSALKSSKPSENLHAAPNPDKAMEELRHRMGLN